MVLTQKETTQLLKLLERGVVAYEKIVEVAITTAQEASELMKVSKKKMFETGD